MDEIKNKVKDSGLIQLDLADFKPRVSVVGIDLTPQLWQGLVLKEKDFRAWIKENDWNVYENKAVYIFCSADAIVPTWAYMLVASALHSVALKVVVGNQFDLEKILISDAIKAIDLTKFQDGKVIVKGCSDIPAPEFAMVTLLAHLQNTVQSIMYGEPCSTVPIYKRKNA
ncbi:MAG: hypothetical protein RIS20_74 [Bacteroidota bacterium]|jgi:hypothetical protein